MTEFAKLNDSPFWKSFGDAYAEIASTFLSQECIASSAANFPANDVAAGIRLASTACQAELRIGLATSADCAQAIGADLCDEADIELAGSLLQELVNLWMGASKSVFRRAEIVFTGGLPVSLTREAFDDYFADCVRTETVTLVCGDASFGVCVGLLPRKNSSVTVSCLREGMVLADDLHTEGGMLLIAAGTRLSRRSVGRLTSMLPGSRTVTVAGVFG